jgi:inosine triphosphate pyrophosphatase
MSQQPQPRPTTLNFITGNANKLAEVQAILGEVQNLRLQSRNVEGNEIQGSIEEVARDKCSRAAEVVSLLYSSFTVYFFFLFPLSVLAGWWYTGRSRRVQRGEKNENKMG